MHTGSNSRLLATKITDFCRKRLTPFLLADTERLEAYLLALIAHREYPPAKGRGVDWRTISEGCGIAYARLLEVKEEVRPAIDAMKRAFDAAATKELQPLARKVRPSGNTAGRRSGSERAVRTTGWSRFHPDLFALEAPVGKSEPPRVREKQRPSRSSRSH